MSLVEKERAVANVGHVHTIWSWVIAVFLALASTGIGAFTVIGEDYNFTVYAFTMAPVIVILEGLAQTIMIQTRFSWPSCTWEM